MLSDTLTPEMQSALWIVATICVIGTLVIMYLDWNRRDK